MNFKAPDSSDNPVPQCIRSCRARCRVRPSRPGPLRADDRCASDSETLLTAETASAIDVAARFHDAVPARRRPSSMPPARSRDRRRRRCSPRLRDGRLARAVRGPPRLQPQHPRTWRSSAAVSRAAGCGRVRRPKNQNGRLLCGGRLREHASGDDVRPRRRRLVHHARASDEKAGAQHRHHQSEAMMGTTRADRPRPWRDPAVGGVEALGLKARSSSSRGRRSAARRASRRASRRSRNGSGAAPRSASDCRRGGDRTEASTA